MVLGNRLYWYLMVEVALEDRVMAKMYGRVVYKFMKDVEVGCELHSSSYISNSLAGGEWQRASRYYGASRSAD